MISNEVTVCINPATGENIGEYRVDTVEELNEAASGARRTQPLWAAMPLKERIRIILKTRRYIVDHLDELAETISRDNGKTRMDALMAEGLPMAMAVTYYCKMAPAFLKDKKISPANILYSNRKSFIMQKPFGVVGIISPWNYPASIPFSEIIMALLAGNTVIFKGASETQVVGHF
ncbi:MAG TPA: aldehyde dehydrogenase family protein, partial [Smithellaceae bacterium]|nr:aldehyde dehydrogenase family protein [Smithellaceae bacterium]